jgi:hypothetical protein
MAFRHLCAFRRLGYPFRPPMHSDVRATISPKGKEQITGETRVLGGATPSPRERVRRGRERHVT